MSGLSYAAALEAIAERGRFGIRLGLGRTQALLAGLGNPERAVRGALVGGTNGKGSVLALAGSALREAGYRTGLTPKPHLVTYRERLEIDGRLISPDAFAGLIEELLPIADRVGRRLGQPTEFELLTAAIFCWFAREEVDVAVVEVGLGGRLDATHAWDGGVAAITNVDLDHMAQLGSTVAAIAREKAAIIGRGDVAVTGAVADARAIIRRRALRMGAPLTIVEPAPLLGWDRDGIEVELGRLGRTRVGLRGRHQAANVAVADAVLDALEAAGIAVVPAEARRRGYAGARWPGRLELLEVARPGAARPGAARPGAARPGSGEVTEVILDGAHNPAGAAALSVALDDLRPFLAGGASATPPALTLVLGIMADKDVDGMLRALATPVLRGATVVATAVGLPRALPATQLAAAWAARHPGGQVIVEPDVPAAVERALRIAPGPVVVAGSLYLVGQARALLMPDPLLADPGAPIMGR